jgi:DNA-binding CsgD family transcriptional regulator
MAAGRRAGNRENPTIGIGGMGGTPGVLREVLTPTLKSAPLVRGQIAAKLILLELVRCPTAVRWCLPRWREPGLGDQHFDGGVGTMADTDLRGRRAECGVLDGLLEGVRGGRSAVLVVRGEAGVGKTALLDYAIESAPDLSFARAAGVESEMELAFAGLHQLCGPMLDRLGQLPGPQRDALRIAFALEAGPAPDRFLVGLAVLSLLSEMAGDRPLVCVVDDVQWMDRVSVQVLAFAARRLLAEAVLVIFAAREPGADLHGLPELRVAGLRHADARKLLGSVVRWPLDERVADRIVAETRGNPLALLELPRGRSMAELAGGFGLPEVLPLPGRIRENFLRRVESLPEQTRLLLAVAAADPTGDPALMHGAARRLGLGVEVAEQAEETELFHIGGIGGQIVFRHPLMRSAAYRAVSPEDRRRVHAALAQVTNAQTDPDRRAWHLAQAMSGPDEEVAAELERSADRAQARGGLAAAAAFLERSMVLTAEPGRRAKRTLAAAQANISAGAFDKALDMLARAEAGPLDEFSGARMDLLRGQIAFSSGLGSDAPPLLLKAAKRLESLNLEMARETYMSAWMAALFAGRFAGGGDLAEVSEAARSMPRPAGPAGLASLVLDGLALLVTEGPAVAAPALQRAASAFASPDISVAEGIRWGWLGQAAASALWDDVRWRAILVRQVQLARDAGALDHLPIELASLGTDAAWRGDFAAAEALIAETAAVCAATGARSAPFVAMLMASLRGDHAEAAPLIEATIAEAAATGQGIAVTYAHWASAILNNGLGRYADALAAAQDASQETPPLYMSMWALPELIEAATRCGNSQLAAEALDRLAETTRPGGTDFGLGIEARSRALVTAGAAAEGLYREAIDRLGRTLLRPELARAQLLYGEWLRRAGRRTDAREQLRGAYEMLTAMGVEGFAGRARRELLATGENVRKRRVDTTTGELTAQEAQIARLARDGLSNPEIGTQLYLSPRTVEWHLRNVFSKLGISSRRQLRGALPDAGRPATSA